MNLGTDEYVMRLFVVDGTGVATEGRLSHQVNAAIDILTDDGYPLDKAMELMLASEQAGGDPEALARHMVRLRKAIR